LDVFLQSWAECVPEVIEPSGEQELIATDLVR